MIFTVSPNKLSVRGGAHPINVLPLGHYGWARWSDGWSWGSNLDGYTRCLWNSETDAHQSNPFQVFQRTNCKVNSCDRGGRTSERNFENNYLKALKTNAVNNQNGNSKHSRTSCHAKLKPRAMGTKQQLNLTSSHRLKTARPILHKSVYCVDNVSVEITENDLTSFVTDQGIRVVSCFKVKPRLTAR